MDSFNDLLYQKEEETVRGNGKENHMQGLFFDLLACLGGCDSPMLPPNFKPKPMTGFCAILDAFNEAIRVRNIGSGTVLEIGSDEFLENSTERATSSSSSGQVLPGSNYSSLPSSATTQERQSSADLSSQSSRQNILEKKILAGEFAQICKPEAEAFLSADEPKMFPETDINNNVKGWYDENKDNLKSTEPLSRNSHVIPELCEEVGPPLSLSEIVEETYKYSAQIKEIKRILQESMNSLNSKQTIPPPLAFADNVESISCLQAEVGNNIAESFMSEVMSPATALDRNLDETEPNGPFGKPYSGHISTYESCTCFEIGPIQTNSNYFPNIPINLNNSAKLQVVSSPTPGLVQDKISSVLTLSEPKGVNKKCPDKLSELSSSEPSKADVKESYYSASEYDSEFKDTEYKEKRKKKTKIRTARKEESSTEEEHLWTSASGSLSEN